MDGYLLVDKPKGWTSFDVVNKIRNTISKSGLYKGPKKLFPVGHTGTLDPLATGLLLVLLGNYTKKATELTKLDKDYEVTMMLGQTSTTGDAEGEKTAFSSVVPTKKQLDLAIRSFVGDIMQKPPVFSAIKVNGQRAYKLAREGKNVELTERKVKIYRVTGIGYKYPQADFTVKVSSGTYIRSLVVDIGKKLGTGAYMSDLRRTKVGKYSISEANNIDGLSAPEIQKLLKAID